MTLTEQERVMRTRFAEFAGHYLQRVEKKELPPWLEELRTEGIVQGACKKAKLGLGGVPMFLAAMWALDETLKAAKPRSAAERRKELKSTTR